MNCELIERLVECEFARFSANDYRGMPDGPEYEVSPGRLPVMFSAPHAVTHFRNGAIKPSEDFTGAIALMAAQLSGAHSIVAARTGDGDPNWDRFEDSAYKKALCEYVKDCNIQLVLDIHGMVAASPALVAIGSADGETVMTEPWIDEEIADVLRKRLDSWCERYQKQIVLNGKYAARGANTVARTVARVCGVPSLQIEVATQLRVPTRRGSRVPSGERIPFTDEQLPVELISRKNANPSAVIDLVESLCEAVAVSLEKLHA